MLTFITAQFYVLLSQRYKLDSLAYFIQLIRMLFFLYL